MLIENKNKVLPTTCLPDRQAHYSLSTSRGFTLVETLLYVSIVSMMLLVMSAFLFLIMQSRTKFQTISEVDQGGIQAMQIISQAIRNAKQINIPAQGAQGGTLSVEVEDAGKTPTVFNSDGANIQIKEGLGATMPLTNSKISVSGLNFHNVSAINTPGIIKFQFTITYINPSGRQEYEYAKAFYGSVALR